MKKLLAVAALSLALTALTGCTGSQVSTVVKDIGIYAGEAAPVAVDIATIISAFQEPSQTQSVQQFAATVQTDLAALTSLCNEYTATPSSGQQASVFTQITALVDKLVQESDAEVLQLGAIKDPVTQQRVQVAVASLDALMHTMDGFIQTTQSQSTVAATAKARSIKLAQVSAYWSRQDRQRVAAAFGVPFVVLTQHEAQRGL